jgi:chromate reductase
MAKVKIAVIVGSTRRESINRKLAHALARLGTDRAEFRFVEIGDLPLYNQDLEGELPKSVLRFKSEIAAADGLLFVTPEHNRSLPALLKNAVDWGARPYGQNSWSGKPAAITGTSPGAIGHRARAGAPAADFGSFGGRRCWRRSLHLVQARRGGFARDYHR